jgi:hypothetical protein
MEDGCDEYKIISQKSGITFKKKKNSNILLFTFSNTYNENNNILNIVNEKRFFEVLKNVNNKIIKDIDYQNINNEESVLINICLDSLLNEFTKENFDKNFYLQLSNNVTIVSENHIKIEGILSNFISDNVDSQVIKVKNFLLNIVKYDNNVDILFQIDLYERLNIVHECILGSVIHEMLNNLNKYISS